MKKLLISIIVTLVLFPSIIFAQDKKLTISDAVIGQWRQFYPEYLSNLSWRGNLDYFTYVASYDSLIQEKANKPGAKLLLTLDDMNAAMQSLAFDSLKYFPRINWVDDNNFTFRYKGQILIYNIEKQVISEGIKFPEKGNGYEKNAKGEYAYTVDNNLFILSDDGNAMQISKDGGDGIVYGETVHRSEFGITDGIYWSPNGNLLAFYRKDESMVTDYPLVNVSERVAKDESIKYPMAGMKSHHVKVGVYNQTTKEIIYLKTGEPKEQYLTNVAWSPDDMYVYVAVLNRGQNHMKMNQYNASTGDYIKTLFEEKHDKYVEPQHPALFVKKHPNNFIWQSRRDGYSHLYLYKQNGELIKQLTKGNWEVTDVIGFDKSGSNLFILSTQNSPIERHVYKLNIKSGKIIQLTTDEGTHKPMFSKSNKYFIDTWSSTKVPRKYDIVSAKGKKARTLLEASNPLTDYAIGDMNIFTIKADDGKTDLYCRLIKPTNFDPNKKYPAIVYVYGGPHAQLVTNSWLAGARMWQYYMAQKGYVMLTVDNRGSANRGLEFENVIHRHAGIVEAADQMKGIDYLKSLGYVDMDRIGVHGWSYGGYMTTSLMTRHPDAYKVGVAGGPVIDWKYYEIMYGERYMDTPDENPEGYKETSLINQAKNLEGQLLIIHGAIDPTVVWQHSLTFIEQCIKEGKQVDYFVYPRHEHNVRGMDRIHLMEKVSKYFDDFL